MGFLAVIVAAVAAFMFGAVWYMILAKSWMAASGVALNEEKTAPANQSDPVPYITGFVGMLLIAGMMRHVFSLSGIDSLAAGAVSGLGVGLFFVSPWIATFYAYQSRPVRLTLIDGGYATFGCTVIGAVLMLF